MSRNCSFHNISPAGAGIGHRDNVTSFLDSASSAAEGDGHTDRDRDDEHHLPRTNTHTNTNITTQAVNAMTMLMNKTLSIGYNNNTNSSSSSSSTSSNKFQCDWGYDASTTSTSTSASISETGLGIVTATMSSSTNLIQLPNDIESGEDWNVSWPLAVVLCIAYSLVFIIGIVGNSFVVAIVIRLPRMRTTTNVFIVNLAIADLLVLIFCLPFNLITNLSSVVADLLVLLCCLPITLLSNLITPWILGEWICKIVPYLQGVSVSASIDTLIAIAIERFLAICHPMKCQISSRNCRLIILIIWTFSLSITLPWAIFFQLAPVSGVNDMLVCTEQWPDVKLGNIYFVVAHLMFCYCIPLVLITICYALILRRVSMRKIPQETKNLTTDLIVQRSKMKVIKMLLLVVVLFALSWAPLYAIFTRLKFGPTPSDWEDQFIRTITPMAQWLGSSNSCINPILYTVYNKKYRCAFKALLTSRSCVSKMDTSSRSSNRINLSTQLSSTKKMNNGSTSHNSNSRGSVCTTSMSINSEKNKK